MKNTFKKLKFAFRVFWHLAKPYWASSEKWGAIGLLISVIALTLGGVYLLVLLNKWNNSFYQALQDYDSKSFYHLLLYFAGLAASYILLSVYSAYLTQLLQIKWRRWMTLHLLDVWLSGRTYYLSQLLEKTIDNPDQRISDDIKMFVESTLGLFLGFLREFVTLISFITILWTLSGAIKFSVPGLGLLTVPGYMVWVCALYAVVGTWITHLVGRKLIPLSFQQQKFEANFRFSLVRLRENAEGVALCAGEPAEKRFFKERFEDIFLNFRSIMTKQKHLGFFTVFYAQVADIFPILVAAPRYFSKEIALGGLMQIASAFGRVQGAMSFFVDAYTRLADWWATIQRLDGFTKGMEVAQNLGLESKIVSGNSSGNELRVDGLRVCLPSGSILIEQANFSLAPGQSILLSGPSGGGKSTLLRAISGIWPFVEGKIEIPSGKRGMVLPQKSYLPVDSLFAAMIYPSAVGEVQRSRIEDLMSLCKLEKLIPFLDDIENWQLVLSPGEQQRVAFVRLLLHRPDWVFMDESTSALDEETQNFLYQLLRSELPDIAILSVAHRRSVKEHHEKEMILQNHIVFPVN